MDVEEVYLERLLLWSDKPGSTDAVIHNAMPSRASISLGETIP